MMIESRRASQIWSVTDRDRECQFQPPAGFQVSFRFDFDS